MIFPKNSHWNMIFLVSSGKMIFIFPENMILFSRRKMKMIFLNKIKVVFLFPTNMKLPFCQKSKDDLFPKNTPKDDISSITEKDDIHSRKDDIGILCTFMETFFHILLSNKKTPGNLIYRVEI